MEQARFGNRITPVQFGNVNDFFEIFKLPFFVLRIFGIFPFTFVYRGNQIMIETRSAETKMAIALYFTAAILTARRLAYEVYYLSIEEREFDFFISMMPMILMRCYLLMLPLLLWREKECLRALINDWLQFQIKFGEVTRLNFVPVTQLKKKVHWMSTYALGFNLLIRILLMYTLDRSAEAGLVILYASGIQTAVLIYWCMGTVFHAATLESFLYVIDISLIKFNCLKFKRITEFWVQLSSLLDKFYIIHSSLFFYQLMLLVVNCMISLYHASTIVIPRLTNSDDFRTQLTLILYVTVTGWWSVGPYLYIETGYQVEKKINFEVKEKILFRDMMGLEPESLHELWNLLRAIEMKSSTVYMRKYLKIDREFLKKVFAKVIDVMIIFNQFSFALKIYDTDIADKSYITSKSRKWIPDDLI